MTPRPVARPAGISRPAPSADRRDPRWAAAVFVLAVSSVEFLNPFSGFQPWNVVMSGLAAVAIVSATLVLSRSKGSEKPRLFWTDLIYLLYLLYCGLSLLWSVSPADTLVQVIYASIGWAATLVVRTVRVDFQLAVLFKLAVLLAVLCFASILVLGRGAFQPQVTGIPNLRGVFNHQQRLGLYMGTVAGLCVLAIVNRQFGAMVGWRRFYRACGLTIIVLAFIAALARLNSVYILAALIITIGVMRGPWTRVIVLASLFGVSLWVGTHVEDVITSLGSEGVDLSLSGRTNVWERTLAAASDSGPLGYGFATFISPLFDTYWGAYRAPHAHNSFLQAYFETGWPGVWLISAVIVSQLVGSVWVHIRLKRIPYSFFLILVSLFASLTGVEYAGKPSALLLLTLLVLAVEMQEASRSERALYRAGPNFLPRRVPRIRNRLPGSAGAMARPGA